MARLDAWKLCPGRNYLNGSLIKKKSISSWYPINIHFLMVGYQLDDFHQIFIQKVGVSPFPSIKKRLNLGFQVFPISPSNPPRMPSSPLVEFHPKNLHGFPRIALWVKSSGTESRYPTNSPLTILTTKITRMSCWNLVTITILTIQFFSPSFLPHTNKTGNQIQQFMACFFRCLSSTGGDDASPHFSQKVGPTKIASIYTPENERMSPENQGLVQMYSLLKVAPFWGTFVSVQGKIFPRTPIGAGLGAPGGTSANFPMLQGAHLILPK